MPTIGIVLDLAMPKFWIMAISAVATFLIGASIYAKGKRDVRIEIEVAASKKAIERVLELEKNNAQFSKLDERGKCLVLMRDSGLPDGGCDN